MSLDGNGAYQPPAPQFPAIPNTIIYADDFNQIILDIATALSTAIFRDGQAAFTANQPMGGFKLTDLAPGTAPADAVNFLQVFVNPSFTGGQASDFKLTGVSTAVTAAFGTASDQIATTQFVAQQAFATALPAQLGNAGKTLMTDGTQASWRLALIPEIVPEVRTTATQLVAADRQKHITFSAGNFAQTFAPAETLTAGWFCVLENASSQDITLTPASGQTIDGRSSYPLYPNEVRLIRSTGTELKSLVLRGFNKTFTTTGVFPRPPGYKSFDVTACAGGGGGASGEYTSSSGSTAAGGGGGGGGAYILTNIPAQVAPDNFDITVGAGGAGGAARATAGSPNPGGAGGSTSLVGFFTLPGGGGGVGISAGQGGIFNDTPLRRGASGGQGSYSNQDGLAGESFRNEAPSTVPPGGGGGGCRFGGGGGYHTNGGAGGACGINGAYVIPGGAAGTSPGAAGGAGTADPLRWGSGGGGGAGGAGAGGPGGAGGNGGYGGAGGGGGGGSYNASSGAGGAGGNGYVTIRGIV